MKNGEIIKLGIGEFTIRRDMGGYVLLCNSNFVSFQEDIADLYICFGRHLETCQLNFPEK